MNEVDILLNTKKKGTIEELIGCTSALISSINQSKTILNNYFVDLNKKSPKTIININLLQDEIEKINFSFQNLICLYDRDELIDFLTYEIKKNNKKKNNCLT